MYLILVHEVGHSLMVLKKGYKLERIELYPCGGCSKFNSMVNIPLKDELLILLAGPFFQILGFYIGSLFIDFRYYLLLKKYHMLVLIFNMLPIYPLDGGRIVHIFFSYIMAFKKSFSFLFYVSYISFFLLFFLFLKYIKVKIFIVVLVFLYIKMLKEALSFSSYYHKFLLERYLYDFSYLKLRMVNKVSDFKKMRYHEIIKNDKLLGEKEYLEKLFIDLNEERRVL